MFVQYIDATKYILNAGLLCSVLLCANDCLSVPLILDIEKNSIEIQTYWKKALDLGIIANVLHCSQQSSQYIDGWAMPSDACAVLCYPLLCSALTVFRLCSGSAFISLIAKTWTAMLKKSANPWTPLYVDNVWYIVLCLLWVDCDTDSFQNTIEPNIQSCNTTPIADVNSISSLFIRLLKPNPMLFFALIKSYNLSLIDRCVCSEWKWIPNMFSLTFVRLLINWSVICYKTVLLRSGFTNCYPMAAHLSFRILTVLPPSLPVVGIISSIASIRPLE